MDNLFEGFRRGALMLAANNCVYTQYHKEYGIAQAEWEMLTQDEPWTLSQRQQVRSQIAEVVNISLTIAGLPAMALPAQYVAAVIVTVVSPTNRFVAATRAPEAFDALAASGLNEAFEIRPVTIETMQSLVIAYSGTVKSEPAGQVVPKEVTRDTDK